jgi:hypothetical protein
VLLFFRVFPCSSVADYQIVGWAERREAQHEGICRPSARRASQAQHDLRQDFCD